MQNEAVAGRVQQNVADAMIAETGAASRGSTCSRSVNGYVVVFRGRRGGRSRSDGGQPSTSSASDSGARQM